jgi:alanine-glyoxylate transaminase/serine-glyoxylate transaminase/serine-pyruvate transaminase
MRENAMPRRAGRHFLQIPGPSNIPDRVLRAMDRPIIDHRGPEFGQMMTKLFADLQPVFGTNGPVVIYPSSGTGAWEAAIVNCLASGDQVVMCETGQFATLWRKMADKLGLVVDFIPSDWRRGADATSIEARLMADTTHQIKAVMVVHNETSTGVASRIPLIRAAIDRARHPALLMVDTISSLGSLDYRHDEWGVDVTVSCSQKGLMLPPGLGFNALSEKALAVSRDNKTPRSYWDWEDMLVNNAKGYFPYSPATNMLFGLQEAINLLNEEGLPNVFARHDRHAEATRRAVQGWGLEVLCQEPAEYSSVLTAVLLPEGSDADKLRAAILERYDMSLGTGLGKLAGKVFRIGHLGDFNDLSLMGTLAGVEMGLALAGVPHKRGGVQAAMDFLSGNSRAA